MGISHVLRDCILCGSKSLQLQYTNELCEENFIDNALRPSTEQAPLRSFLQPTNVTHAYLEERNSILDWAIPPVQRPEVHYADSLPDRQGPRTTFHLPITASSQLRALWGNALGHGDRGALLNLQRACDMMAALVPASFVCVDVMGADHHVSCTLAVTGTEAAEAALPLGQPRVRTGRESTEWTIRLPLASSAAYVTTHTVGTLSITGAGTGAAAAHMESAAAVVSSGGGRVSGSMEHRTSQLATQDSNTINNTISSAAAPAGRVYRTAVAAAALPLTAPPHHSTSAGFPRQPVYPPLPSRNTASADGTSPNGLLTSPSSALTSSVVCHSSWRRRSRAPLQRASLACIPNQRAHLPSGENTTRQQKSPAGGVLNWVFNERNSCPTPQTNVPKVSPRGSAAISDRGVGSGYYRSNTGDSSSGDIATCLEPLPPHIRDMAKLYGDTICSIWAVPLYEEGTDTGEGMSGPRSTGSGWYGASTASAAATEAEITAEVQAAATAAASDRGQARRVGCPERRVIGVLYMFGSTQALFSPADRPRFRAAVFELSSYLAEGSLQILPDLGHRLLLARSPLVAAEVVAAALGVIFTHRMQGMGRVRVYPAFLCQRNQAQTPTPNPIHTHTDQTVEPQGQHNKHSEAVSQPCGPASHHMTSQKTTPTIDLILMLPPAAPLSGRPPGAAPSPTAMPLATGLRPGGPPAPIDPSSAGPKKQDKDVTFVVLNASPSSTELQPSSLSGSPPELEANRDVSTIGVTQHGSDSFRQDINTCTDSHVNKVPIADTPQPAAAATVDVEVSYGEQSGSAGNTGAVGTCAMSPVIQLSATSAFFASLGFPLSQFTSASYDDRTSGDVSDSTDVRGSDSFQTAAPPQARALDAEGTLMAAAAAAARSRACRGMILQVAPPPLLVTATATTLPPRGRSVLSTALTADLDVRLGAVGTAMWVSSAESLSTATFAGGIPPSTLAPPQSSVVFRDGGRDAAVAVAADTASGSPADVRQLPGQPYHVLAAVVRTAEGTAAEGATELWPGVYLAFSESLRPELMRELQASLDGLLLLIGGSLLTACASETAAQELAMVLPPGPQQLIPQRST